MTHLSPQILDQALELGLIGRDLSYSLSPDIHNTSFEKLGIQGRYQCYEFANVEPLKDFLDSMFTRGAHGFNVTQPFKKIVAALVKTELKSVNTLQRSTQGWIGHSTDGIGLQESLLHAWQLKFKDFSRILFFGSGGVVEAILEFIQHSGATPQMMILGRSDLNTAGSTQQVQSFITSSQLPLLVIHATSAKENPLRNVLQGVKGKHVYCADLNYQKDQRYLYDWARQQNLPAVDGLPMLIEQARASQTIWFGRAASYEDLLKNLCHKLAAANRIP